MIKFRFAIFALVFATIAFANDYIQDGSNSLNTQKALEVAQTKHQNFYSTGNIFTLSLSNFNLKLKETCPACDTLEKDKLQNANISGASLELAYKRLFNFSFMGDDFFYVGLGYERGLNLTNKISSKIQTSSKNGSSNSFVLTLLGSLIKFDRFNFGIDTSVVFNDFEDLYDEKTEEIANPTSVRFNVYGAYNLYDSLDLMLGLKYDIISDLRVRQDIYNSSGFLIAVGNARIIEQNRLSAYLGLGYRF